MINQKITAKKHLINFLKWTWLKGGKKFYTHDIQDLSLRSKMKFGRRLGSPDTYKRAFRQLKQNNIITCKEINEPGKRESAWLMINHSLDKEM